MKQAERQKLRAVVNEIHSWIKTAEGVQHLAAHLPLSPAVDPMTELPLLWHLQRVAASGDLITGAELADRTLWFARRSHRASAHEASARLVAFHAQVKAAASDRALHALNNRLATQADAERAQIDTAVTALPSLRDTAAELLLVADHMPLTRSGILTADEVNAMRLLIEQCDLHAASARRLLNPRWCVRGNCEPSHASAKVLRDLNDHATASQLGEQIASARLRVDTQLTVERTHIDAALISLFALRNSSAQLLLDAAHMPITRAGILTTEQDTAMRSLIEQFDQHAASARRLLDPVECVNGTCEASHASAKALCDLNDHATASQLSAQIASARHRADTQLVADRAEIDTALNSLFAMQNSSAQLLLDAAHMPITRAGILTTEQDTAMRSLIEQFDQHAVSALGMLDSVECVNGTCEASHASAKAMCDLNDQATASQLSAQIASARHRADTQLVADRAQIRKLHEQAQRWPGDVQRIRNARLKALSRINTAVETAFAASVTVPSDPPVCFLPLTSQDSTLINDLELTASFVLTASDEGDLTNAVELGRTVSTLLAGTFTPDWKCARDTTCVGDHDETARLIASAAQVESDLSRLTPPNFPEEGDLNRLLEPRLAFGSHLPPGASNTEILDRALTARAKSAIRFIADAPGKAKKAAARARTAGENVRVYDVASALKAMDLDVLRKAATNDDRFRTAPLEAYGLHNVWDVFAFQREYKLSSLPGLGAVSARAITQATLRIFVAVRDETPVRIDVKRRSDQTQELLHALRRWDAARRFIANDQEIALASGLQALLKANRPADVVVAFHPEPNQEGNQTRSALVNAIERLWAANNHSDVWTDFLSRPADFFGMLTELGFITEDEKKMHGDLPEEIIEAARAQSLKGEYLTASLRTYQSFGARFALVQKRVLIGDEMGLGKTVEALAIFAHLRACGESHFLVVCPAAVVSNWIRETQKHTKLRVSRLHGSIAERTHAAHSWKRRGGVAVTTYDLLPWAKTHLDGVEVSSAVFDEAHYIKNPNAKRSAAAADVILSTKYAVLMTGTPLENSVDEFRNLIGYLRPDLSQSAPDFLASKFRRHVAPAYLRRNQEDVLTELPELVEIDEWLGMSDADTVSYRAAVQEGNFMLMRRAAMLSGRSLKVERLLEIVDEAESNGRRVIVFSYFREVLDQVARLLPGDVFGPLTGSTAPNERQTMVDRFSSARGGAVLVAQISAGGVGLNIQSASVVVICEPQLKPTLEAQAIARAHRMGQTNSVQVHRLLSENSVDERIREILTDKAQLFDNFARDSVIAERAPDAVDVTDAELARIVIAAERERLFGQPELAN